MTFDIPYPPTKAGKTEWNRRYGLNAFYSGMDKHDRSRRVQALHDRAIAAMKKARIPQKYIPWPVEVVFRWNDGLDIDNHAVMGKAFVDAMITVITDVVRENNQTYRLGWTEQCKDGTKMGVGCPEYILLFRKLPTDTSKAYADEPVRKTKEEYTRARWQIDAHGYWRSSGDRLLSKEELSRIPVDKLQAAYRKFSRNAVYDYSEHVELSERLDEDGHLPSTFMVVAPGSWSPDVWDDVNRMRTLNTTQSQRRQQLHVCPLQLDIVERLINRYSNPGDLVFDPFGGIGTVPLVALKMDRRGMMTELNGDYFRDAVGYLREQEQTEDTISLFDIIGGVS